MSTLASVILINVFASRPAASIPGRLFFSTDTNVQYRDNGTSWDVWSPSGSASLNFADDETVSGSGTAWTLAHTPSPAASLILVQEITGFGGITLIAGTDYTLATATITTTNSLSTGVLRAWYRY